MVRMYVMIVSSYLKRQLRILSGRSLSFQNVDLLSLYLAAVRLIATVDTVSEIDGSCPDLDRDSRSLKLNLVATT